MAATWNGDDSPHLSWKCAQVTGKAGENGQHSGEMDGGSPWTNPSAPGCGDTLKALAGDQRPIWSGDRPRRRLQGHYRLGHRPVVLLRTAGQRKGRKGAAAPYPSVGVVVTEKVMREADGPVGRAALTAHFGRRSQAVEKNTRRCR